MSRSCAHRYNERIALTTARTRLPDKVGASSSTIACTSPRRNLSQPFGCEPRPCVDAQALVDVVDRARLVPAAVLIQRAALARRGYEARTGLVKSDTPLRLQGASVELAFQVRAGIARRLERGHKTGLDGTPPAWVPAHAEVRRLAVAARRPVGVEGAALLMTGEDSAGSGLRIYPGMPGMTLRRPASLATVLDDPSLKF